MAAASITIDVAAYANPCGRWTYRHTEDGYSDIWNDEVLGTRVMNGKPVYFRQSYDEDGDPNDQEFLSADMSKGLFQAGGLNDYGQPSERTYFWKPGLPLLMETFVPGKEYTADYTQTGLEGVVATITTIVEPKRITIPYGTLDCYKVTQKVRVSGKLVVEKWEWYAKHLGVVKHGESGGGIWELVSYQPAPRIIVEHPVGTELYDGMSKTSFGTVAIGKGATRFYTIKNEGTANVKGLVLTKDGAHSKDFIVSAPAATTVAPGKSTTFKVTFKPSATGIRHASIHITSLGANRYPFDIKLSGMGVK